MIIHIRHRESPFVQIDKRVLEHPTLSWKAKGVLSYLLSRPPNWIVRSEQLISIGPDGKVALQAAFRELRENGYARLEQVRSEDGARAVGKEWVIYEEPLTDAKPASQETRQPQNLTVRESAPNKNEGDNKNNGEGEFPLAPKGEGASSIKSKEEGFAEFWTAYPKKKKKDTALRAWKRKGCSLIREEIMLALAIQKGWASWTKGKPPGQFIPYPASWLNGKSWEDEERSAAPAPAATAPKKGF